MSERPSTALSSGKRASESVAQYQALEARILAALRDDLSEAEFSALALEIHYFQRRWNEPYGRWCQAMPDPTTWTEIPAAPQAMFKRSRISCFPPDVTKIVFRTSGTTGETRGEHHFLSTVLYDASVLAGWRRQRFGAAQPIILAPSPVDAPDSSLAHMLATVGNATGAEAPVYVLESDGALDPVRVAAALSAARAAGQPVALLGTALGFLNLLEKWTGPGPRLTAGSFLMETGGFKGSGRDIPKAELYAQLGEFFGLEPEALWNEYGMCELSSQFYMRGLGGVHRGGPWVRAVVIDPDGGSEAAMGQTGLLRIFDLANLGSVLAVQTADLAVRREDGFELVGRDPAATPRGCSRQADETMRMPEGDRVRSADREAAAALKVAPSNRVATRVRHLAKAAEGFPFLGAVSAESLVGLIAAELRHPDALDDFVPYGSHFARAVAPGTILHILSANTPAAALQTLMRGLLLGSHNLCKLPSGGLPEVAEFVAALPTDLAELVELNEELPDEWLGRADAVIVFGSDATIEHFRGRVPAGTTFLAHGHRLSFGIVFDDAAFASVEGAARDASVFDQQGCLSPHVYYVQENGTFTAAAYAEQLATAMAVFEKQSPRRPLTVSEANAIRTLREETSFRMANGEPLRLFASSNTAWTVIVDASPGFPSSPLNRVVFVKPLPIDLAAELAPVRAHLSTCGLWPSSAEHAEVAMQLGVTRICPIGEMQRPPVTWHQDGQAVLAPLVRWVDWES